MTEPHKKQSEQEESEYDEEDDEVNSNPDKIDPDNPPQEIERVKNMNIQKPSSYKLKQLREKNKGITPIIGAVTERLDRRINFSTSICGFSAEHGAIIQPRKLQLDFLEKENSELKKSYKDLEKNLKLNKQMLDVALAENREVDKERALIDQLRNENALLTGQLKELVKEKEDQLGINLINQQIIENAKEREQEMIIQLEEQAKEFQELIDKKEYTLQTYELKIYHYEKYLQRKALTEKEGRHLLFKFQNDESSQKNIKISNVVEDNINLRNELREAFQEMNRLQAQTQDLSAKIVELEDQLEILQKTKEGVPLPQQELSIFEQSMNTQQLDLDKLKRMEQYFPKEYQQRVELMLIDMEKQLKNVKKEKRQLKSENNVLKEANESNQFIIQKLNNALSKAQTKIKKLELQLEKFEQEEQEQKLKAISDEEEELQAVVVAENKKEVIQEKKDGERKNGGQEVQKEEEDLGDKIIEQLSKQQYQKRKEALEGGLDPDNFGNMSSIMINPNELNEAIYASALGHMQAPKTNGTDFNLAQELENE